MSQTTLPGIAAEPEIITFAVNCIPKGQPRLKSAARMRRNSWGKEVPFVHHYTPDTADAFKRAMQLAANRLRGRMHDGPVRVDVTAYFPRTEKRLVKGRGVVELRHVPADAPRSAIPMTVKPDRDNIDKVVLDALTQIGVWKDDMQVYGGCVEKYFAAADCLPGVRVTITLEPWPEWKKRPKRKS